MSRGTQSSKQVPSKQQTRNYKLVVAPYLFRIPSLHTMSESNSSTDSFSSAQNGLRCCHHQGHRQSPTLSSSISTPTSPVDSNLSSAGTLEVRDVPLHFSLVSELTTLSGQSPFHRPCLDRRLQLVLCPRLVSPYDWRNTHPRQAFRRQVRLRV